MNTRKRPTNRIENIKIKIKPMTHKRKEYIETRQKSSFV
jgi:hypothetical protein